MKLNPELPFGADYSPIALALFLQEVKIVSGKAYSIMDYSHYLYRFYSDIGKAKDNHYYRIINEIWHYQPLDIYDYSKNILKYVEENIGLIYISDTNFYIAECPSDIDKNFKLIQGVIQTMVAKYIGNEYKAYDSRLKEDEYSGRIFDKTSRVFYRALELMNYCFISDERDLNHLYAVALSSKEHFDEYNYLILGEKYAHMYNDGSLHIKKNGYPYIHGKRLFQHIDIATLKKIRENLEDV